MEIKIRMWSNNANKYFYNKDSFECLVQQIRFNEGEPFLGIPFDHMKDGMVFEQYTGLNDTAGKEIYEGDILKCSRLDSNEVETLVVKNSPGQFSLYNPNCCERCKSGDGCTTYLSDWVHFPDQWKIEIIGTVHENPELISKLGYSNK